MSNFNVKSVFKFSFLTIFPPARLGCSCPDSIFPGAIYHLPLYPTSRIHMSMHTLELKQSGSLVGWLYMKS